MRSIYLLLACIALFCLSACESENERRNDNNSFLPNTNVDFTLELSRPTNADLRFNGGELFLSRERALGSLAGVYIFRASASLFLAYDLAEPNHPLGSCTIIIDEDRGIPSINMQGRFEYDCNSEKSFYDSKTGQIFEGEENSFPLRRYSVFPEMNGDQVVSIRITS